VIPLPLDFSRAHELLVDDRDDCLVAGPATGLSALTEVRRALGREMPIRWVSQAQFEEALQQRLGERQQSTLAVMEDIHGSVDLQALTIAANETPDLLDDEQAPVVRLINALIAEALRERASDIHFESYQGEARVRFRIDGVMKTVVSPPCELAPLLASRVKIMSRLDIAERRLPQDGRMSVRLGRRAVDLRVSTIPSAHGERVVLRLLEKNAGQLSLDELGMESPLRLTLGDIVRRPHGIFLVTGPTGSGKTTTLYAALQELDGESRNIMTVEDPVEYELRGVSQTQINLRTGMSFSKGLRAILRQDPDVILVGEIRDAETAEIAVQASLTGHLVLSTLHTNTALGAVTRLQDLGVDSFLVASTLAGVLAQRLVRRLCPHCREPLAAEPHVREACGLAAGQSIFGAHGCPQCNGSGFAGRMGIFELITVGPALRTLIHDRASEHDMERVVRDEVPTLRQAGLALVAAGHTTVEEVLRVTAA
jgi:general secretion pathway protein E